MKLTVYLAGAIRDGKPEDIAWREAMIDDLRRVAVILNPLAGKHRDEASGLWTLSGRPSGSKVIVHQDFWAVDRADIIVFNLLPMAEGYLSIGTMAEWGRSTTRSVLRYVIAKPNFTGRQNAAMFKLHPFIAEYATDIFATADECRDFLRMHIGRLSGARPRYGTNP